MLAQVLAAATFPDQITEAARWADEHHYSTGGALAKAIADDHLPWDPSVQALVPFPSVLEMMAKDMAWTAELGEETAVDTTCADLDRADAGEHETDGGDARWRCGGGLSSGMRVSLGRRGAGPRPQDRR